MLALKSVKNINTLVKRAARHYDYMERICSHYKKSNRLPNKQLEVERQRLDDLRDQQENLESLIQQRVHEGEKITDMAGLEDSAEEFPSMLLHYCFFHYAFKNEELIGPSAFDVAKKVTRFLKDVIENKGECVISVKEGVSYQMGKSNGLWKYCYSADKCQLGLQLNHPRQYCAQERKWINADEGTPKHPALLDVDFSLFIQGVRKKEEDHSTLWQARHSPTEVPKFQVHFKDFALVEYEESLVKESLALIGPCYQQLCPSQVVERIPGNHPHFQLPVSYPDSQLPAA